MTERIMKHRQDLRILLLQIRSDEETLAEELRQFVQYSGLSEEQFKCLNVFEKPHFSSDEIQGFDGLFVGGSSDASVLKPEKFTFIDSCAQLLRRCIKESIPTFASCYGFQAASHAMGGEVEEDRERMEMGIHKVFLKKEAQKDPLLHDFPTEFWAVLGHKEHVTQLPPGFTNLAFTPICPNQLFRVEGKPFYGTQFHPEVNGDDLVSRITRYKDRYGVSDKHIEEMSQGDKCCQDSHELIHKFVDRIILKQ